MSRTLISFTKGVRTTGRTRHWGFWHRASTPLPPFAPEIFSACRLLSVDLIARGERSRLASSVSASCVANSLHKDECAKFQVSCDSNVVGTKPRHR